MTGEAPSCIYRFGRFELKPAERCLLVDDEPTALGTHAFDLLMALVERAGRLVTKDELLELVWPKVVVEENNIQVHVSALRKILGAEAIATVQRKGYRFALATQRLKETAPTLLAAAEGLKTKLPVQVTSFVGRKTELAEIRALLAGTRLLTLTGAGGCGKTRLSLEAAAGLQERFPDGVWCVELAPLADPRLVPQTVATVLGVQETASRPIAEALIEYLDGKRLLLLLDNCEHVLDACARLVDTIVRRCAEVRMLASSRQPFAIAGEQTYRVPSLTLPDAKHAQTPETLAQYESVQLFIERAQLVCPEFALTVQSTAPVASLCRHLDGIPLAIELAAARMRSLSVEEIDSRLDQRFRLLTDGSRTALPRHRTLRSLIDWSYDFLDDEEKRLLQRLSVFAGGWTLGAAEEVCDGDGVARADVLDLLASLCDKSLVIAEQVEERSRYRLLETVRQYARERLVEDGGGNAVRRRHRRYFVELAESAGEQLRGSERAARLRCLDDEHENLRAALAFDLEETGSQEDLRICVALRNFWDQRGIFSEGREWFRRVLEKEANKTPTRVRAKALTAAGILAYLQSDFPDARARAEESLAIARESQDQRCIANALNLLAGVMAVQCDFASSNALLEEVLAMMRERDDRYGIVRTLLNLAVVICRQGNYALAQKYAEEGSALARQLGDCFWIAVSKNALGEIAYWEKDYPKAGALHSGAVATFRELGVLPALAEALADLGEVTYVQGDNAIAWARACESLTIRYEIGDRMEIAVSLETLAAIITALGDPLRAARIRGAVERLREEIESPRSPNEDALHANRVAEGRSLLRDDAAFDSAWQEGKALTLGQAIELALTRTRGCG